MRAKIPPLPTLKPRVLPLEWKEIRGGKWLRAEPAPGIVYEIRNDETASHAKEKAFREHERLVTSLLAPFPVVRRHPQPARDEATRLEQGLERMNEARDFPRNTCPASRHVQIMAEALASGERYAMLDDEPEHVAASLISVLGSLFEARSDLAAIAEPPAEAAAHVVGDVIEIPPGVLDAALAGSEAVPMGGDEIAIDPAVLEEAEARDRGPKPR